MSVMATTACAGCASASTSATIDDATPPQQTVFTDPNVSTIRTDAPRSSLRTIPAPVAVVRTAVQQACLNYSIPLSLSIPAAGRQQHRTRRAPLAQARCCADSHEDIPFRKAHVFIERIDGRYACGQRSFVPTLLPCCTRETAARNAGRFTNMGSSRPRRLARG